jgi:hypothetical protein
VGRGKERNQKRKKREDINIKETKGNRKGREGGGRKEGRKEGRKGTGRE